MYLKLDGATVLRKSLPWSWTKTVFSGGVKTWEETACIPNSLFHTTQGIPH